MATILLCDDEIMNQKVASKILIKEGYEVMVASNGKEAVDRLKTERVDLILMDLMMPVMDGFEAISIIKKDPNLEHIPLIITSALSDKEAITRGLKLGADEYITKPFDITEFVLRVNNAIKIGSYHHMLEDNQAHLERLVQIRTKELQEALLHVKESEKDIIAILSKTAEYRDNETSMHTVRVGEMAALMAEKLNCSPQDCELMRLAAPMHDIGKVGIEDAVLLKPGKLSDEEFSTMKLHAKIGYDILASKPTPLLQLAATIALTHHEKYDGSGYPQGLSKEEIPQSGAIVAIVDVFDALLSERPYKKAFSIEKTVAILQEGRATHFNPDLLDIFLDNLDAMLAIRKKFSDN